MSMTVKEWAAEYRAINEAEQADRVARLPRETVEESVRGYFSLAALVARFAVEAEDSEGLRERRLREYEALAKKWKRLARMTSNAHRS